MTSTATAPGSPGLPTSYMSAVRSAPFAVMSAENLDDLVVVAWNREAERLFGYTADEVVGLRLTDTIVSGPDAEAWRRSLGRRARRSAAPMPARTGAPSCASGGMRPWSTTAASRFGCSASGRMSRSRSRPSRG